MFLLPQGFISLNSPRETHQHSPPAQGSSMANTPEHKRVTRASEKPKQFQALQQPGAAQEGRISGSTSCQLCLPPLCIFRCLCCAQMPAKPRVRESLLHAVFHSRTRFNVTRFYPKSRLCHFSFLSNNHSTVFLTKRDRDLSPLIRPITVIPLIRKA